MTKSLDIFSKITKPTLLLNPNIAIRNIKRISGKCKQQNIHFRPHFKTHQSRIIGQWFRSFGVKAITVSSLDMAEYFAQDGWDDILIAFPVNIRQLNQIEDLALRVHLELLIESLETLEALSGKLTANVDIWIKVDIGAHRTGIAWNQIEQLEGFARHIQEIHNLHLRGLLTHAGHTYKATSPDEVCRIYDESIHNLYQTRDSLQKLLKQTIELSVGDTPSASLCEDLGAVDEIRPGNFIFYDAHQLHLGSCSYDDIAVAVACPVVARHTERHELVIYGGAIHLSKDTTLLQELSIYGLVCLPSDQHWGLPLSQAYVKTLSQEHGIIRVLPEDFEGIKVGDLLCVIPSHSCLTVQAMNQFMTLDGEIIPTMNSLFM